MHDEGQRLIPQGIPCALTLHPYTQFSVMNIEMVFAHKDLCLCIVELLAALFQSQENIKDMKDFEENPLCCLCQCVVFAL